ncbi:MAG: DUF5615 family PIN-like protein [Armatimonadetes bacterium]|nr:DUF5615 family PIN-like protein [Armatimonadota bacterium]
MILADHCVYHATVQMLQQSGYSVTCLKEIARSDLPDQEVLQLAIQRDQVLLTVDKGFSNILRYLPVDHSGIIVLKIAAGTEEKVHKVLLRLFKDHDRESLRHRLAIVDAHKYRLRS